MGEQAEIIARTRRTKAQAKWNQRFPGPMPEDYKYGFTFICNNCGSMNVTLGQVYADGEHYGTSLRCGDCEQDQVY